MGQAETIGIVAQNISNEGSGSTVERLGIIAGGILFAIAALTAAATWYMGYVPADLDTSTERTSEQGHYRVSYEPDAHPVPINQLHSWTLAITTPDGTPVEDARIAIDGDMPQHGHGLPTEPQATDHLGAGRYRLDGMKFQMNGWWFVQLEIAHDGIEDRVRFDFVLP